jgi:pimeloyl-ACP methyl ester carboxylesterase
MMFSLAQRSGRVGALWATAIANAAIHSPELVVKRQARYMSPPDRAIIRQPAIRQARREDLAEAVRQGAAASALEARLHVAPWGFDLADIACPAYIWQGSEDNSHPAAMAQSHAACLPHCELDLVPGVGALGFVDRQEPILRKVAALGR